MSAQNFTIVGTDPSGERRPTIPIGPFEDAEMAIYNDCGWPVDVVVLVTPYGSDGADFDAERITRRVPAKGFGFVVIPKRANADATAFAAVEVGCARGRLGRCAPSGRDSVRAAVALRSSISDAVRDVIQVECHGSGPEDARLVRDGIVGPRTVAAFVIPVGRGGKVHIPVDNTCKGDRSIRFTVAATGLDGVEASLAEVDLGPRERTVLSVTPRAPDGSSASMGDWFFVDVRAAGGACASQSGIIQSLAIDSDNDGTPDGL